MRKRSEIQEKERELRLLLERSQEALRNAAKHGALIARNNEQVFQQLTANVNRLQSMSRGVIRMQEAERSKISRELHDGVGQSLTALKMNLDLVSVDLSKHISKKSRQKLEDARKMAEQSLGEVRELSRLLRPRILDDLGLLATLRWAVRTFSNRTGIDATLDAGGISPSLDSEIETMLFRVTQEGLNNIAKHSNAKSAQVSFSTSSKSIRLTIRDEGDGFDVAKAQKLNRGEFGSGLSGIRDRVVLWGGNFAIRSEPGSGTTLEIEVPAAHARNGKRRTSRRESNGQN